MKSRLALIATLLLAAVVAYLSYRVITPAAPASGTFQPPKPPTEYTSIGQKLPDFDVESVAGQRYTNSSLKGKVALLNLWATWCDPCAAELPRIETEIWRELNGRVVVLAIARGENASAIHMFNKRAGLTFPLIPDTNKQLYSLFADGGIPRNYVIDSTGVIVYQSLGYSEGGFHELVDAVRNAR